MRKISYSDLTACRNLPHKVLLNLLDYDFDEIKMLPSLHINCLNIANSWGVELVFNDVGFKAREILGFNAILKGPNRDCGRCIQTEHFGHVFSHTNGKLLAI